MKNQSKTLSLIVLLVILVAVIVGATHVRSIEDWWRLRGYNPPAAVAQLGRQDTMTPLATRIFYVNHPDLESNVITFRQDCQQNEQTIVLGCYHSDQDGIFIYDVNDPRLRGVQQVTAAHEMLHAAYDRLSSGEKNTIDKELLDFYNNGLQDQRIKDTINSYRKSEPDDVVNEMHSIFGTEVASLPAPLENYYKRYFSNRSAITTFASNYEGEFTSRINEINADDAQLATLKANIQAEEQSLQSQLASLQTDRASVENSSDATAISQYNARVTAYNSGVRQLQRDIAQYNNLVDERNSVATELRSLQSSIDTRLTTQPAQ